MIKCVPSYAGKPSSGIDILVTHPSAFSSMVRNKLLYWRGTTNPLTSSQLPVSKKVHPLITTDFLRHLVIDEADILAAPSPIETDWIADLKHLCLLPHLASLVFVTASISKPFYSNVIKNLAPAAKIIHTKELHKPLDVVKQKFYKVSLAGSSKPRKRIVL